MRYLIVATEVSGLQPYDSPSPMQSYYVYILANQRRALYVGVTVDLVRRVCQHREKANPGSFTARHSLDRLVYFEACLTLRGARAREARLKRWKRIRKVELVECANPRWRDLAESIGLAARDG